MYRINRLIIATVFGISMLMLPILVSGQGKIAFQSCGDGNCEIYLINPDGTGERRLTFNSAQDTEPSVAANGTKIAFNSTRDGNAEIYTMNLDGSQQTRVTHNSAADFDPAFSSDGSRIVFVSNREGTDKIYVMSSDGSNQRSLGTPGASIDPSFHPNGNIVVFASNADNGNWDIYYTTLSHGGLTRLTTTPADDVAPAFDLRTFSNTLYFTSWRDGDAEIFSTTIFGSTTAQITRNVLYDVDPSPSADARVAFTADPGNGDREIYVMTVVNGNPTSFVPLTNNAVHEDNPSWGAFFEPRRTVSDFDFDGKTDLAIFRPGPSEWWVNNSRTGTTFAARFGAPGDIIAPADYTGDGKTDITVWRPSTGTWLILRSEDFSYYGVPFGTAGDIPTPGEFDADGEADLAIFRPSEGLWYFSLSQTPEIRVFRFGASGDVPIVIDLSPGESTQNRIGIYRPSNGQWWIWNPASQSASVTTFGTSSDKPVPGDYTGDGVSDIAFWRPSTGEWFVIRSGTFPSFYSFPFGTNGDIPAPGDYDGDGVFDATIFRPSTGTWYSLRSTGGTTIRQFGVDGDRPIPNAFVP